MTHLHVSWRDFFLARSSFYRRLQPDFSVDEIRPALREWISPPVTGPDGMGADAVAYLKLELYSVRPDSERFLVLGAPGAGKTTFMLRLYRSLRKGLFRKPAVLLSLNRADTLHRVAAIPDPEKTILLLDALDEDPSLSEGFKVRMDEVLKAAAPFYRVVISCQESAFPPRTQHRQRDDLIKFTGEETFQIFMAFRLRPWTSDHTDLWIDTRLPGVVRADAKKQVEARPELYQHPAFLPLLAQPASALSLPFQAWGALLEQEARLTGSPEQALSLARDLAANMYRHHKHRGGWLIPLAEATEMAQAYGFRKLRHARFLVSAGKTEVRFRHAELPGILIARMAWQQGWPPEATLFSGMDSLRNSYRELAWSDYLRQSGQMSGECCLEHETEHRPLDSLKPAEIPLISRLYLRQYRNVDLRLLRSLDRLRGIYLEGGTAQDFHAGMIRELPHAEVFIYLTEQGEVRRVLSLALGEASLASGRGGLIPVEVRSPHVYEPARMPEIGYRLKPRGDAAQGSRNLLRILSTKVLHQPDISARRIDIPIPGEAIEAWEGVPSEPEYDLFSRVQVYIFPDGTRNLLLYNSFRPTMLFDYLKKLVNDLSAVYGEDDFHRERFTSDDIAQIQDGFWLGRRWTWGLTDSYAYPVHLYMDRPGLFRLCIFGLETAAPAAANPNSPL